MQNNKMSWKLDMLKGKESKTVKQNHCICPNCKGKKNRLTLETTEWRKTSS